MSRVQTEYVAAAYCIESALGVATTTWKAIEPNDITDWGNEIKKVPRRPISRDRQRRKGANVSVDSKVGIEFDLTHDSFLDFIDGYVFAQAANWDTVFQAAPVLTTGYTVPSGTANQAAKLQWVSGGKASLLFAQGYANAANNGLKVLTADFAATNVLLATGSQGNVVEGTPPSNAVVELCGIRALASGDLSIVVTGATFVITSAAAIDFTTLGIKLGQEIHIGGSTSTNQFANGKAFGRVTSITASTISGDKLRGTITTDTGSGKVIDILYGRFFRNLAVTANADDARYLERSYQFELEMPELGGAGVPNYEYSKGNYASTFEFDMPMEDKAMLKVGFVGTETENPTGSRKSGASSPVLPLRTTAFNTTSDLVSLQTTAMTNSGSCWKKCTVKIDNQVTPEKCLGSESATFLNVGLFLFDISGEAVFSDPAMITGIRNNTTFTWDATARNADGAITIDVPEITFSGGTRSFPRDESVRVQFEGQAHRSSVFGYSVGISHFPLVPAA